jgi:hypothetical protein
VVRDDSPGLTPPPFPLWVHIAVVGAVFVAAYAAGAGSGFIKDDAEWIVRSRIRAPGDLWRLFTETGGFFRPVVGLSFAVNHWMFGARPLGYGWTNLALAVAGAVAIYRLTIALGLPRGAGAFAASVWMFNFHGIAMAVLWLSGRTALLLVLFAVLSATAAARNRLVSSCAWALLAMFSKEEAVLLPVILVAVAWLAPVTRPPRVRVLAFGAGLAATLVIYAALRSHSDAMTSATAPPFYTFTFAPPILWRNFTEYADRATSLSIAVVVLAAAMAGWRPAVQSRELKIVLLGAIWTVAAFGLTMFLPVRSSLYACLPSVGAAIGAAAIATVVWRAASAARQRAMACAAILLPVMLLPVYWQRNVRWTELGDVSTLMMREVASLAPTAPRGWELIVVDDRTTRSNVASALGWALPAAAELTTGKRPKVWIVPPPPDAAATEQATTPASADAVIAMRGRRLVLIPKEDWQPALGAVFY